MVIFAARVGLGNEKMVIFTLRYASEVSIEGMLTI
jgi:hypothetical protein